MCNHIRSSSETRHPYPADFGCHRGNHGTTSMLESSVQGSVGRHVVLNNYACFIVKNRLFSLSRYPCLDIINGSSPTMPLQEIPVVGLHILSVFLSRHFNNAMVDVTLHQLKPLVLRLQHVHLGGWNHDVSHNLRLTCSDTIYAQLPNTTPICSRRRIDDNNTRLCFHLFPTLPSHCAGKDPGGV